MTNQKNYDLCVVINDLGAGGSQRVLTALLSAWEPSKRIAVVTLGARESDFYVLPDSVDRYVIGGIKKSKNKLMGLVANLRRIFRLRAQLQEIDAPVILSLICPMNILTIVASWGVKSKIIISERNDPSRQSFGVVWNWLRRRLYRYADYVTANTRGAIQSMSAYVPSHKLRHIPNPIALLNPTGVSHFVRNALPDGDSQGEHRDAPLVSPSRELASRRRNHTRSEFRKLRNSCPSEKINPEKPMILNVGRLHPQKAHDVLLQAFSCFIHEFPGWQLVILGEGPLKEDLQRHAESLGIHSYVDWRGNVKDIEAFYKAATFFVLPSRYEGMPNALLEAMSRGLPPIITDASPGPLEYVEHNESGLVVPVDDVEALSYAMKRLAENKSLRERLSENARKKVKPNNLEEIILQWENLFVSDDQSVYEKS